MSAPQIVLDLQSRLSSLLVRMTAVEALLGQEPLLTGRYTAAAYIYISKVGTILHPSMPEYRPVAGCAVSSAAGAAAD